MKIKAALIAMILLLWLIPRNEAFCMSVNADGSWSKTITTSNLTSGAGSNLTSTYESSTNQANVDISLTLGILDSWKVNAGTATFIFISDAVPMGGRIWG